jgi:predicted lipoprotein with Yx(FWY)xxD motif
VTPRGERRRAAACSQRDQAHASNERSEHDSHLHHLLAGATALVVVALAVAGCGGSGGSNANSPAPPKTANGQSATVGVANENVGNVLVDSQGRTLYLFERDSGTKSACTGACAAEWPPLRATGKPTVGAGTNASIVATSDRSDGKPQVTHNGHPLYLFSADQKAGDTNGQGVNAFGGLWYVLSSSGDEISTPAGSSGGFGY